MDGIALAACLALARAPQSPSQAPADLTLSDHPELIVAHAQSWGLLGLDTCAHAPGQTPLPLQIGERKFEKGLGSHANGEIVVDLGGAYARFEAEVGVQWQQGTTGSVVFALFADDEELWKSGVLRPADRAVKVSVPLAGRGELRLVATDAGDGITCDCADWADARLVPAPSATPVTAWPRTDVAPFASVRTWNWQELEGTHASRLDEFPAADLFPWSAAQRTPNPGYLVPAKAGFVCIGLEWPEPRRLARLELTMDEREGIAPSAIDGIRVEQWLPTPGGGSTWQGRWVAVAGPVRFEAGRFVVEPALRDDRSLLAGTTKIRWIAPAGASPIVCVRPLVALSRSRFQEFDLLLTAERPGEAESATITVYNGSQRDGGPGEVAWNLAQPLHLPVSACTSRHAAGDRTVLRIAMRKMAFGVAVADVVTHGGVWVADAGLYVTDARKPLSLADYRKRFEGTTPLLQAVREHPEQTLAAAMARLHQPLQDLGPTLISLPADNRKFIVERDGTVRWDDRAEVYDCVDRTPDEGYRCATTVRFGDQREPATERELADLSCLGLELRRDVGMVHYTMKALVTPPAIGDLRLAAENRGSEPAEATLQIRFAHPAGLHVAAVAPPANNPNGPNGSVAVVETAGQLLAWVTADKEATLELIADGCVVHARVAPRERAQARVLIPRWPAAAAELADFADPAACRLAAQRAWQHYVAETAQIELPDPELERIVAASLLHCLAAARAPRIAGPSQQIAPWIASVSYGPLESEAQAVVRGMQSFGAKTFAAASHRYFADRVDANGRLTTGYTLIGTGWHLWTLGEYDALFADDATLRPLAPSMVRACRWIMAQRRKTMRDERQGKRQGERDPHFGLMPPGPLADWNLFASYFYANANYCAGLRDAAAALARIGSPDAAEIAADAKAFRDDIVRAWHFASSRAPVVPLRDGRFVPYFPTQVECPGPMEEFHPGEDAGRSWCYDVEVGPAQMVALGMLAPDAPEAEWIVDQLEEVQFLRDGWFAYPAQENAKDPFTFGGFAKVQPYYARTVETYALRDDPVPFLRSYFNTIPTLLNREDLSLWEHFAASGAWNKTHETGYFLYQTRTMLLTEHDDELWLAPFVPRAWFADGKHLSVANAPTRFGPTGYSIVSHVAAKGEGHRIEVTIDPPTRRPPVAIVLRLRHPDRTPIRAVTVDGQESVTFDAKDGTIWIEPRTERIAVRADY